MKRRVLLTTINTDHTRFSLSIELIGERINRDPKLRGKISLIKKVYPALTPQKEIIKQILVHSPQLIGFSCYVWNIVEIYDLASAIKKHLRQTRIVIGGPEVTDECGDILEKHPYIDGAVIGEGEETFAQWLTGWLNNDKLDPIPGTVVRYEKRIIYGSPCLPIDDLHKIPSPYNDLKISAKNKSVILPLQTLRGCNGKCLYCYYGKNFPGVRFFPLERINENLKKIKKAGIQTVGIIDPNFFCHFTHAVNVIRILSEKRLRFQAEANAEDLDERTVNLLANSTCYQVNFGIQSSNPDTQRLCGRSFNLKRLETNIRLLAKKAPTIHLHTDLIYGLPGDTLKDFLNSLDFAFSLPIEQINFFHLRALPGTPFNRQPEKWGIYFDNRPPYMVNKTATFSSEDIKQARTISQYVSCFLSCRTLGPVIYYILKKVPGVPSLFFNRFIAWDQQHQKRFLLQYLNNKSKGIGFSGFQYFLSSLKYIHPGLFSARDLEYLLEWYKFRYCLYQLEKKSLPRKTNRDVTQKRVAMGKCSDNIRIGRFRIKPGFDLQTPVPAPLEKKARLLLMQKDRQGIIRVFRVSEGMENLLTFFKKPKPIKTYLTASIPENSSLVERHNRIRYAIEKGFIQHVENKR